MTKRNRTHRKITLTLEVIVPATVGESEVELAVNSALDQPLGEWGDWVVGAAVITAVERSRKPQGDNPMTDRLAEALTKETAMNDREILLAVQKLLDGQEWDSETIERVAELLNANGYEIREPIHSEEGISP